MGKASEHLRLPAGVVPERLRTTAPWRGMVLAVLLCALVVASCGGDAKPSAGKPGGTLRIATGSELAAQDPQDYNGSFALLDMVFEPLVRYGPDGVLKPALATAWKVSDDGLTVRFDLRHDVTFQDGTAFDAKAAKWNFDRWVAKKKHSFFATSTVIKRVEATGPYALTLRLRRSYQPLLQELSYVRPVRFLSPSSVGADGKFAKAVGTGPWLLRSSSPTAATLVRNDRYWGAKPGLDRVEFRVIKDSQTRLAALRAGEVDVIGGSYMSPITPTEAADLKRDSSVQLLQGTPDVTVVIGFNAKGVAGDRAVRDAVRHAVDAPALTKVLYSGFAQPASTLFAPGIPDAGTPEAATFDPGAASKLLDDAGWRERAGTRTKGGKPLVMTLLITSSPVRGQQDARLSAEALAASLKDVGIGVKIKPVDDATYFDERTAGKFDLSFFETYGAPYDPPGFVVGYLRSDSETAMWATPALDKLIDKALFATDDTARERAYQAVYDDLDRDVAFVPIAYRPRFFAVSSKVAGFKVPVNEYELDLAGVTLRR
jgi:nickel ABC transporter nickel/metallophore binding protein